MNMYLHELKAHRKNTLIWVVSMIAIAALYLSMYAGIDKDAADFKSLLANYPPQIRAMLGVSLDNITAPLGFYSMIISFVVLCGAIQAMNLGLSLISKESRERTADFLLVKPISRTTIVNAKLLAAVTLLLATNVFYFTVVAMMTSTVIQTSFSFKGFFLINLTLLFIQLIFFALGLVISVFFNKLKTVLPISLGTVFGLYLIGTLIATDKDDVSRFISPFKYFDNAYIMKNESYEGAYLLTGVIIVIVAIIVSYIIYNKKDIHAVS